MKKYFLNVFYSIILLCITVNYSPVVAHETQQTSPGEVLLDHYEDLPTEDHLKDHKLQVLFPDYQLEEYFYDHHQGNEPSQETTYIPPSSADLVRTAEQVRTFDCSTVSEIPQIECEALVALYGSTNGAGWTDHTNWLDNTQPSTWYGVILDSGHVISIHQTLNNLVGSIPAELGNLSNMLYLYLNINQLTGSIPPELGSLNNLVYFGMYSNQLTGSIPSALGSLSSVTVFEMTGNQLTGSIPPELGNLSSLVGLFLDHNQLTGSIPSELGSLSSLRWLDLGDNQLTGSLPSELGSLFNLNHLDLSQNDFLGYVPAELSNLTNLCIKGTFPAPCNEIWYTDLGYNHLNVPALEPPASFLAIKDPDWYMTQAVTEIIPCATGGTIVSNDGDTEIVIPAGAVSGETTFRFHPQPSPDQDTGNLIIAGNSFELTAEDIYGDPVTVFSVPITLTIEYDEAALGAIIENTLSLYYWDVSGSAWLDVVTTCPGGVYTRDLVANWLSVPVCHLSEFSLLGMDVVYSTYLPVIIQ
jgi:hypothetical protein